MLSIHGGYWRDTYSLDLNVPMVQHLVSNSWTVANIEYRRVPLGKDGTWDEMSSDVLAAIAAIEDQPRPLILLGHSAGGQLALWAAAQPETEVDALVTLAPVSDLFLADDPNSSLVAWLLASKPSAKNRSLTGASVTSASTSVSGWAAAHSASWPPAL